MLLIVGYGITPWSPKPFTTVYFEDGVETGTFSPYALAGSIVTPFWLIFCMGFKPIAKHIFPPWAMEEQPIDINTVCKTCSLYLENSTLGCYMSPKKCGKYTYKNGKWKVSIF
jgi:hypothetical protein